MKILRTDLNNFNQSVIFEAIEVMADGGVILYPTDTIYGLGADIFNKNAVKRIFEIKRRVPYKPLSILLSSKESIGLVAKIDSDSLKVIDEYLPGQYTLILNKTDVVSRTVTGGLDKVGVRVPDCELACELAKIFPIISTSANISNKTTLNNPKAILEQLDCDVDLVIDVGQIENSPSTIIDLTENKPNFIKR